MKPAASTSHPGLDMTASGAEALWHEALECENHVVRSDFRNIYVRLLLLCWKKLCTPLYFLADTIL